MKNINLGIAITLNKELRTIRSITNRLEKYKSYRNFHQLEGNKKVKKLIEKIEKLKKITEGKGKKGVYNKTRYNQIRIAITKFKTIEEQWEKCTNIPWTKSLMATDRLLSIQMKTLKTQKIKARVTEQKWRLTQELLEKAEKSYYIIFNTLTIDPKNYSEIWSKGSKIFTKYTKFFDISSKYTHGYFAVREAGESNGRLHIHCIHTMKYIPNSWKKDPNDEKMIPTNREIYLAKKAWPYGFSNPIAVRFNTQDAFSKLGWRWPIKEGKPLESSNPKKMANYISKYLIKTLNNKEKTKWKTKIKRDLGIKAIQSTMKTLTIEELNTVATLTTGTLITLMKKPIPKGIITKEATREILNRMKNEPLEKQLKKLTEIIPQPSIIKQWNNLTMTKLTSKSQNILYTETRHFNETESSNIKQIIEKLEKTTRCIYNPEILSYTKHITPTHRNPLNV